LSANWKLCPKITFTTLARSQPLAATEAMLADSGVDYLRNGFYADAALRFMGTEWQRGSIAAPADGKVAWTTHADLAEAAAVVLTGAAVFEGPTLPLTGSESFDLADQGWSLLERSVDREVVDDDVFRERLVRSGMPQSIVAVTLGFYEASRRGGFAKIDGTMKDLIKRLAMRQVLADAISDPR
jgi:NAD(P)H dehydrogenase (quinone)